jgi:Na+-transporting NADH:ubiquinone oxidoreductase subunit A
LIKIKRGLNLPINGSPEQQIYPGNPVTKVALVGPDFIGMKPDFAVAVGDQVKLGQLLFSDKKRPEIRFTSPAAGRVVAINRGEKRVFLSLVIELDGKEEVTFCSYSRSQIKSLTREVVIRNLLDSGLWIALRSRPFGRIADPTTSPHSIFVTAMDTNPLAPSLEAIVATQPEMFTLGLEILTKLTDNKLFVCKSPNANIPVADLPNLVVEEFVGPHPAGNVGTHIHFLDPVSRSKTVWYIGLQDVIAIGQLFTTGHLAMERIVALGGPALIKPRLIRTCRGAATDELVAGELQAGENRIISGSVLSGYQAMGVLAFLGFYHQQISIIAENRRRKLFGWFSPGLNLFSVKNVVLSRLIPHKTFDFDTNLHGGMRGIVPVGSYEKVMPLDILPTYLLRALAVDDIETAELLGCLELEEEDLALCTFVCPSKLEHGDNLRRVLTLIEKEG